MTSPRCLVMSTATAEPMDVNIQLPVGQVCKQFGLFVTKAFSKPPTEVQGSSGQQPRRNGFALLAEGARKEPSASCLPEKRREAFHVGWSTCGQYIAVSARSHVACSPHRNWHLAGTAASTRRQHVCMRSPALLARARAVQQGHGAGGC